MAHKLFVGGLPYATTEDQLRELFEKLGPVDSVQIIIDRETNRSKGFGFVTMTNDDDAKKAIDELDGQEYEGRRLAVNEARPKEPRMGGAPAPARSFSGGRVY